MTSHEREASRSQGEPIGLFLFKGADPTLESMLRSVTIIPGTTEFGYGTTRVTKTNETTQQPANYIANLAETDFVAALDDLTASATDIDHVSLVVAWHGSDLRCGVCEIRPKVEFSTTVTTPYSWQVGPVTRPGTPVVTQIAGKPAVGGAPADRSVYEALVEIKARGLRVTVYPFILMDIAADNSLPDPYGGTGQPAYPWRGRITCNPAPGVSGTVDKTAAAATQINTFFGAATPAHFGWDATNKVVTYSGPAEWSFRRFILHMATIAKAAGVDDFIIGSELVGLTTVRSDATTFPAVAKLITLANDVRTKLGAGPRISYASDWSEYHSYRPTDGSGDVFFHLDPLWASSNIDFIGIDNYLPTADWRDGVDHLDYVAGFLSGHDRRYLQSNIEGGEYYDWFYASLPDRIAQVRTPITDGAHDEPWIYRNKDLRSWWSNPHHNRPGGVRSGSATAWTPESKPIVFTEIGCGAVNKGANQPNMFIDAKSSESSLPYFSSGIRDDAMQRAYLEAWLEYWRPESGNNPISAGYGAEMVEWKTTSIWTWDARPYPAFPARGDYWGDVPNWLLGHWINGRIYAGRDFDSGEFGPYAYTDAEQDITLDGITYQAVTIDRAAITASGSLDKAMLKVSMQQGLSLSDQFLAYPPAQVVNLIIRQGHYGDDTAFRANYPVVWTGRVLGCAHPPNETEFTCEPISTSIKRPGLRRNYQIGCPHVLYGSQCKANRKDATITRTVVSIAGSRITLPDGWEAAFPGAKYLGGMIGWQQDNGAAELRSILRLEGENTFLIAGTLRGLAAGDSVQLMLGCARNMGDCANLHSNIHNYGGQPFIPTTNPVGAYNPFY